MISPSNIAIGFPYIEIVTDVAPYLGVLAALDGYSAQQDPDQYHIQTDEDDERYFVYQTHNGQYRKERRLKDGSVVGTTGWVGADGYLRLQDYIADGKGYRIHKSKTVYVGVNRPISESIQIAKTAPTDPGYGVTPAPARPIQRYRGTPRITSTTQAPSLSSTTDDVYNYRSKPNSLSVSITPKPYLPPTASPEVYVTPNSIDSSTKTYEFRPTVTPITASEAAPTSSPYNFDLSNTNNLDDGYYTDDSKRYDVYNPNLYRHADQWMSRSRQQSNQPGIRVGDGYTPQFPAYDGVSITRNGFRYYLPKQYHEEESSSSQERTGSFGYIDPFGIRRVIYYNTAPGQGFQIRKNNRNMLTLALCLFLATQTFGRTHHHHRNNVQLSLESKSFPSSKDSTGFSDNITDADWVIPDVKYLHDVEEILKVQPDNIEHRNTDDSKTMNTTTTPSINMAITTSKPMIDDEIRSGETPLKVQGVINAPIIIVQTPHQRRRHQGFKQTNTPKALTSSLIRNVLPPIRHQHSKPGLDKWDYDSMRPDYEILNEDFIIEDTDTELKPTLVHPTMFHIQNSPREHNIRQYVKRPPPPVPSLLSWYDCFRK
ncbi:unnamed protein product [Arctia plantaginis]|uniref:Uncharacterized protein n=1 Tax=Arctia plantaginis TaxID=874455 RepID=A0A8S1A8W5_ARCPL|nr:unnamed protein product [Arctia plantaginis]